MKMNFDLLYKKAFEISPKRDLAPGYATCGSVGSALMTKDGNIYTGICIDCTSGIGFCAEHAAVAEMLKNGESEIVEVIAVNQGGEVLSPCGRCRELILQVNLGNKNTVVHLGENHSERLGSLLPEYWILRRED